MKSLPIVQPPLVIGPPGGHGAAARWPAGLAQDVERRQDGSAVLRPAASPGHAAVERLVARLLIWRLVATTQLHDAEIELARDRGGVAARWPAGLAQDVKRPLSVAASIRW